VSASESVFFSIFVVVFADLLEGLAGECGEDGAASRVLRRFKVTLFEFGVVGKLAIRVGVVGWLTGEAAGSVAELLS